MAAPRRAPTPLRSSTSSSPLEAMIATKQAHIEELVIQTRTLEHKNAQLAATLKAEQARAEDAVSVLQKRWQEERAEWQEGCDNLQAAHRIAHLRTAIELDRERSHVLTERETLRKERLARLQRDFRLVTFQRRETELEERVAELEIILDEVTKERERKQLERTTQMNDKATALEARCEKLSAQLHKAADDLAQAHQEKAQAEETASRLKAEVSTLLNSSKKAETSLERTTLQLDGFKSRIADLEKKLSESEQTVSELRRQLEKWQRLENREGAEIDTLRRERTELVLQVETLQVRMKELSEERDAAIEVEVEKRKKKNDEFQEAIAEWKTACDDAQRDAEESQAESERLEEQLLLVQQEVKNLQSQLAAVASTSRQPTLQIESDGEPSPKPVKKTKPPKPSKRAVDPSSGSDDDEVQELSDPPGPPSRPRNKKNGLSKDHGAAGIAADPTKNGRKHKSPEGSDIEQLAPSQKSKQPAKESPRSRTKTNTSRESEEAYPGAVKATKKAKPREEDEDEQTQPVPKKRGRPPKSSALDGEGTTGPKKRGNKATADEQDGEISAARKRTTSKQSASSMVKPSSKDGRSGRNQNKQLRLDDDEDEPIVVGGGTPTKKKRKLNVFPTVANPPKFNWDPTGNGSLEIPTELSPVKDGDAVPPKKSVFSTFGSVLGSFGSRR